MVRGGGSTRGIRVAAEEEGVTEEEVEKSSCWRCVKAGKECV